MMTPRKYVERALMNACGDDLERCEAAFRGMSDAELDNEHGQSGETRRAIRDGYRRGRAEWQAAWDWFVTAKP